MSHDELVEKMASAYNDLIPHSYGGDHKAAMSAALRVAVEEMLSDPTCEESGNSYDRSKRGPMREVLQAFLSDRRSRLSKPKSVDERVAIVVIGASAPYRIEVDGQAQRMHFGYKEDAEIYRLGLIQQLKSQPS